MGKFKIGDQVFITKNKTSKGGRYAWHNNLNKYEGAVGVVYKVDMDGAEVRFVGNNRLKDSYWWWGEMLLVGNLTEAIYGK